MNEINTPQNNDIQNDENTSTDKEYIRQSIEEFAQILYEYHVKVLTKNEIKE